MRAGIGDLGGLRIIESPLVPYGQAVVMSREGFVVISTAPRPTRWRRFRAWLRRTLRRTR